MAKKEKRIFTRDDLLIIIRYFFSIYWLCSCGFPSTARIKDNYHLKQYCYLTVLLFCSLHQRFSLIAWVSYLKLKG
jgi:hypothetical protein